MQNHHLLSLFCVVQIHGAQSPSGTSGDSFIARWWNPRKEEIRNQKGKPEWHVVWSLCRGGAQSGKCFCLENEFVSAAKSIVIPAQDFSKAISLVPLLCALQPSFGAGREGVQGLLFSRRGLSCVPWVHGVPGQGQLAWVKGFPPIFNSFAPANLLDWAQSVWRLEFVQV